MSNSDHDARPATCAEPNDQPLRESEELFRNLSVLSSDWHWEQDEQYRFTFLSPAVGEKTGVKVSLHIGRTRWELPALNVTEADWAAHRAQLDRREPFFNLEVRRPDGPDGRQYWISVSGEPVFDASGRFRGYRGVGHDITAQKLAEEQLRATLRNTPHVAIQWFDEDGRIALWNPASERLYGFRVHEALGCTIEELKLSVDGAEGLREVLQKAHAAQGPIGPMECAFRRRDGSEGIALSTVFEIPSHHGRPLFVRMDVDLTERKLAEERLAHLAHHDTLTGLPNRTLFHDRLSLALAQARRNGWKVGLLFIDLDRFKMVNDTLGHVQGDQLLRTVSERLVSAIRSGDSVARLGGDEFAVILPDMPSSDTAAHVAQKLLDALAEPVALEQREMFVSASIGITVSPTDGEDPDALIRNADTAMFRAKELGRGGYQFFAASLNERALHLLDTEHRLRRALERGEFLLHYQPRAEARSGRVLGAEALLRWAPHAGGVIMPEEFIPILEDTGLIVPVGNWVLRQACAQLARWDRAGLRWLSVSVNVSPRQFRHAEIVQSLKKVLAETGADPRRIELEITEGLLMQDTDACAQALREVKALGVRIAIDDFGTGYSSLSYLKRFAIDSLKIDRSFIRDIPHDLNDAGIATAVIAMANKLGLRAVAEGVEMPAQHEFLIGCGCDEVQGFLYSHPLPERELDLFLAARAEPAGA